MRRGRGGGREGSCSQVIIAGTKPPSSPHSLDVGRCAQGQHQHVGQGHQSHILRVIPWGPEGTENSAS